MENLWERRAETGAWRWKGSLPGEHGRPCYSHMSHQACEVDRMHASRRACAADYSHTSRRACTADFLRSSCLIKQLHARHQVWLNFDMVNIIQPFAILTCHLFVSKRTSLATNVCASSQTGRFFYHDIYVPCHETITTKKYTSMKIHVCHSRSRFCHACTSMMILWQNQDSHTCAVIEVFHDITKIIITEVSLPWW